MYAFEEKKVQDEIDKLKEKVIDKNRSKTAEAIHYWEVNE